MDRRTDEKTGKRLFRWEPKSNIVSVACKNTVYDVKLRHEQAEGAYEVIGKHEKPKIKK